MNNILAVFIGIQLLFIVVVLGVVALGSKRLTAAEKSYRSARRSRPHRPSRRSTKQD